MSTAQRSRAALAVALLGASLLPGAVQAAPGDCAPGQAPAFGGGFATLKAQLADWQGDPISCEFADPSGSGDIQQRTSTGLAIWRKSTNVAMFTNGVDHWAVTDGGLVYWSGPSIDPPADARLAVAHPCIARGTCLGAVTVALPAATDEPVFETRAGPRTTAQIHDELAAAGYAGPWDTPAMLAAYARADATHVVPNPDDNAWTCLPPRPTCQQDPWWAQTAGNQDITTVTYTAIGNQLRTERRFADAINLIWQLPQGKTLLKHANETGVQVITIAYDEQIAYAAFVPQRNVVVVNARFTAAPTWMVASVLAHELTHAADPTVRSDGQRTAASCFAAETAAYTTEQQYLGWLAHTLQPQGLPDVGALSARLSDEHAHLARSLYQIAAAPNMAALVRETYSGVCD